MAGIDNKGEDSLSVRANWFAGDTQQESDQPIADPFSSEQSSTRRITLKSTPEQFMGAFSRLNKWGNRLDQMGVRCPLRESGECHCSACPISQANDPDAPRSSLCRQGAEEERVVMLERASRHPELIPAGGV